MRPMAATEAKVVVYYTTPTGKQGERKFASPSQAKRFYESKVKSGCSDVHIKATL